MTENSSDFVPDDIETSLGLIATHLEIFLDAWAEFGEQSQETETPPTLADFLPKESALKLLVLPEMIKVDLECRWLTHNFPKRLSEYLSDFPFLSREKIPADLIYEEFHVRKQAGLVVDPQEYLSEWPQQSEELQCFLSMNEGEGSSQLFQKNKLQILSGLKVGQLLDEFELLNKLGEGAFAHVYLARQSSMQRLVALKISVEQSEEPQTLAQLDHDYIVRVFDQRILSEKDLRLLYMQYLPGGTLLEVLREMRNTPEGERTGDVLLRSVDRCLEKQGVNRPSESSNRATLKQLSWGETISWLGAKLADGLDHAHRHGVLHRDIKPANVLLTGEGIPKLADFNISFSSEIEGATPATYFGGSLAYMSPEQLEACQPIHKREAKDLDERADVYSLGTMLWVLLTGKRPFLDPPVDSNWSAMVDEMIRIRREGFQEDSESEFSNNFPSGLVRVLKKCLHPNPKMRWQSGKELAIQLELCMQPEAQQILYPEQSDFCHKLRPWALVLIFFAAAIPNIAAGVFNSIYNDRAIVDVLETKQIDLAPEIDLKLIFFQTRTIINLIAYPLGLALVGYLTWTVTRISSRFQRGNTDSSDEEFLPKLRKRCLSLGHFIAILGIVEWSIAGLAYPVTINVLAGSMEPGSYLHFFGSLVLCGLIAAAYPFFLATVFSLRVIYPCLVSGLHFEAGDAICLKKVKSRSSTYLVIAALVPMLSVLGIVVVSMIGESDTQTDQTEKFALLVLGLVGVVGFYFVYRLYRRLQSDLDAMIGCVESNF